MGTRGKFLFDLNKPPSEEAEDINNVSNFQEVEVSSQVHKFEASFHSSAERQLRSPNEYSFSYSPHGSAFQPFVRPAEVQNARESMVPDGIDINAPPPTSVIPVSTSVEKVESAGNEDSEIAPLFANEDVAVKSSSNDEDSKINEKEEGECSEKEDPNIGEALHKGDKSTPDKDGNGENAFSLDCSTKAVSEGKNESRSLGEALDESTSKSDCRLDSKTVLKKPSEIVAVEKAEDVSSNTKVSCTDRKSEDVHKPSPSIVSDNTKDDIRKSCVIQQNKAMVVDSFNKSKSAKCVKEQKYVSYLGNKRKVDEQTEAKLGKKRNRQTVFLNLEDVRQTASMKVTSKRQSYNQSTNSGREHGRSSSVSNDEFSMRQNASNNKDQMLDPSKNQGGMSEIQDCVVHVASDDSSAPQQTSRNGKKFSAPLSKKIIADSNSDGIITPALRQSYWKPGMEQKSSHGEQFLDTFVAGSEISDQKIGGKRHASTVRKQSSINSSYQDSSVERLHREVTSEKFWHHPGESELQCVPGRFDSAEDYVRVFEPLLFEECRAQLYSTWEELCDTGSRDAIAMVRVKSVDRRERGWYDATIIPMQEFMPSFKEGDVAILSTPKPGSGRFKRTISGVGGGVDDPDSKSDLSGRVAGTIRKYTPIDTRQPEGAIIHFYVGDSYDYSSKANEEHVLVKLQKENVVWFLAVLGSLATTQREYVALHAFRRLNYQMQKAILDPSPDLFPKYKEQAPSMPDCFTSNFVEHLHKSFNGPQLAAIQWAAMHTAAGTSGNAGNKRQEPWPFTLVQGPPGTGKTHTVWGMLNVIHLVQYQHYYCALLKKLAPETYGQTNDSSNSSSGIGTGSIDEVLKSMDRNLLPMLPKLCPKPRMLVCAPSNAATDELLQRVLDRGFIDGEMKVYRPDVARVGVDSQNRAAQAVSVERRADYLLRKSREEVATLLHQLHGRRIYLAQQILALQRDLSVSAAAGRAQGTVGVDPEVLAARDHARDSMLQNLAAVVEEHDKVIVEISRLSILENRYRGGGKFNIDEARSSLEVSFANEAEIVFTTVSSSGRKLFQRLSHGFDMVVIDEAAQASEVAVLPPLSLGAARCVLVGDPQQLPATVISQAAGTLQYSRSLFERFQQAECPTMLLSVQYRMHPEIRLFPSRYFYENQLSDSESVINRPDEVFYQDPLLRPYLFYDIMHGRESHRGGSVSYQNVHEAQFALHLYEHLQKLIKPLGIRVSVGIITPYKLQLKCLQREFERVLNTEEGKGLYINTVDAFQGQERDVIIMSCVRASTHGVGFVADIRRMNVALTRARKALWVMGNAAALKQSPDWSSLIEDAKERGCFMDMDSLPKDLISPRFFASFGSHQPRPPLSSSRTQRQGISSQRS
eukprot:TRINITY_DN2569_c0_g2_i2.p1 TRINITY_DN2569_c0_g2~~TRINITY_DN2569_c0_g2_i2.p1  ORF type:complete len:1376 (-),score=279.38 TRINITY_DN2569_c0_g2_i2:1333-5460(-)